VKIAEALHNLFISSGEEISLGVSFIRMAASDAVVLDNGSMHPLLPSGPGTEQGA
jgi:hypothetical protein